jgi:histone H3/H4
MARFALTSRGSTGVAKTTRLTTLSPSKKNEIISKKVHQDSRKDVIVVKKVPQKKRVRTEEDAQKKRVRTEEDTQKKRVRTEEDAQKKRVSIEEEDIKKRKRMNGFPQKLKRIIDVQKDVRGCIRDAPFRRYVKHMLSTRVLPHISRYSKASKAHDIVMQKSASKNLREITESILMRVMEIAIRIATNDGNRATVNGRDFTMAFRAYTSHINGVNKHFDHALLSLDQ